MRDLAEHDELLRRDLAAGHARHDRVGAVALDVGEEAIVGVLQRQVLALQDVLVPGRGEDRRHRRLADLAALPAGRAARADPSNVLDAVQRAPGEELLPRVTRSARRGACSPRRRPCAARLVRISETSGTHEPQPVPALVHALIRADRGQLLLADRAADLRPCSRCGTSRSARRRGARRRRSRPACSPARGGINRSSGWGGSGMRLCTSCTSWP